MIKQGLLSLAVLLLCYSYSNAYEQQYQVGDTGPNGGTVTSVSVVPTLSNTTEEMVGDFLETTYTYTYTETINETVQTTTYETVNVIQEKTDKLIDLSTYTDTNVSTNCYATGVDICTGNQSTGGGSRVYDFTINQDVKEIDYGSSVTSHVSNSTLPTCANTTGDCQDEFKITVRLYDNGVLQNTYTHNYSSINWAGTKDYAFTQDTSSIDFNTAQLELYGVDAGYYSGYYGPAFGNTYFDITYDYLTQVINQIITQNTMTTVLSAQEYAYDSEYIPPPPIEIDYSDYTVDAGTTFEMQLDTFDGGIATFEIEVIDTPTGEFEISINEIEPIDVPEVDAPEDVTVEVAANEQEPEVSENQSDTGSNETATQSGGKDQESSQESKPDNKKGTNGGSTAVAYSVIMDTTRLIVMQQSEAVKNFNTYTQVSLPVTEFYAPEIIDGGKTYDNPYGIWFMGASDTLWNEMVDMQWQR